MGRKLKPCLCMNCNAKVDPDNKAKVSVTKDYLKLQYTYSRDLSLAKPYYTRSSRTRFSMVLCDDCMNLVINNLSEMAAHGMAQRAQEEGALV